MKVVGLTTMFILISLIDIISIAKKANGKGKYFAVHGLIIIAGFTISLLQVIKKAPVSPAKVIESIIKGIIGEM